MTYQWQNAKPGVGRPTPNFAHPLWRGCLFASTVGSSRGHRQQASPAGDIDDRFGNVNVRSQIFTTGGFTPNGANWQNWSMGRGFDNGDGTTSLNPQGWADTDGRYDITRGATWAVIVRPDLVSANTNLPIFKRRAQPYGAAQSGWHFSGDAGNLWRFEMSDGVTERSRTSSTVQGAPNRSDLLVARYFDLFTGNGRLQLHVNGIMESSTQFAFQSVGNPAGEPIKILGYDALNGTFPGFIPFAAVWNRPLSDGEMAQVFSDPFVMWRWLRDDLTIVGAPRVNGQLLTAANRGAPGVVLAPGLVPGAGGVDGGCCCCAAASSLLF